MKPGLIRFIHYWSGILGGSHLADQGRRKVASSHRIRIVFFWIPGSECWFLESPDPDCDFFNFQYSNYFPSSTHRFNDPGVQCTTQKAISSLNKIKKKNQGSRGMGSATNNFIGMKTRSDGHCACLMIFLREAAKKYSSCF